MIRQAHTYLAGAVSGTVLIAIAVAIFVMLVSVQAAKDWPLADMVGGDDGPASADVVTGAGGGGDATAAPLGDLRRRRRPRRGPRSRRRRSRRAGRRGRADRPRRRRPAEPARRPRPAAAPKAGPPRSRAAAARRAAVARDGSARPAAAAEEAGRRAAATASPGPSPAPAPTSSPAPTARPAARSAKAASARSSKTRSKASPGPNRPSAARWTRRSKGPAKRSAARSKAPATRSAACSIPTASRRTHLNRHNARLMAERGQALADPIAGSAVYPRGSRVNERGRLEVGGCDVVELAAEFGTPAYVYAEDDMRFRARAIRPPSPSARDDFEVVFASKAFPCTAALRLFAEEGLSCDVASGRRAPPGAQCRLRPERIYMHGNNKSAAELEQAVEAGVGHVIVDSFDEIERLGSVAAGRPQRVLLRVTPGIRPDDPRQDRHRPGGLEVRHPAGADRGRRPSAAPPPGSRSAACTRTSARRCSSSTSTTPSPTC